MLNSLIKIFLFFLSFIFIYYDIGYAGVIDLEGVDEIESVSIDSLNGTLVENINDGGFSILGSIKTVLLGIFVLYMVYAGAKMVMSMGTDEEKIKTAKRQIWYGLIGIVFINLPGTLYNAFFKSSHNSTSTTVNWTGDGIGTFVGDEFLTFLTYIIGVLEFLIFFIALFVFIFTGIKLILGGTDQKTVSEAKLKILYSLIALVLVGFIEIWKDFAFTPSLTLGVGIFTSIANLLLYITPLIALFFLVLAGYYYITSGGDKEKVTKAKNIILYILLGTLIFLASYTVLLELNNFSF